MKSNNLNWYVKSGMLILAISLFCKNILSMPDFMCGFGIGAGIGLELIGLYVCSHDMSRLKNMKINVIKRIVHKL